MSNYGNLKSVVDLFETYGETDRAYLEAHFERWLSTKQFAMTGVMQDAKLIILDVGAHWLHNAYLYAIDGHNLICTDAPGTLQADSVIKMASDFGMTLVPTHRMELGEGFDVIDDNSVDLVLFCEIIEHLTFNPIPFWKEIYRILRPGGRIIITTPNSFYYRSVNRHYDDLIGGERIGIPVNEIMEVGTYGHHWKEFSLLELINYFSFLSTDFPIDRWELVVKKEDIGASIDGVASRLPAHSHVRSHNIYLEVCLPAKVAGVTVSPPWIPA